jgi:methylmalonyl-CoA/ethylmalonyl-CoA epimerase
MRREDWARATMKLDHIGIVVKKLESYGEAYASSLGLTVDSPIYYDPIQKVRIQFWSDGHGGRLELIEAASEDSPVKQALEKGRGLNHLCYEVNDIEARVQEAANRGAILTSQIVPAVAFGGRRVAFLYFRELGLIEFVEANPAAPTTTL